MTTHWKTGDYAKYACAIRAAEHRYGIPRELLARLMCYDPETIKGSDRNPLGAVGIAQLTPDIAKLYAPARADQVDDPRRDPWRSIEIAGVYLAELRDLFGDWRRALLAFRWGAENVRRAFQPAAGEAPIPVPLAHADDIERISADVRIP